MLSSLRRASADLALSAMAVAMGAASLVYPFGRDQGLYFYVAREWVQRGAIPYRDVLDHKTPGIYILYAAGVKLFGPHAWGIRLLDLVGVAIAAMVIAELTARPGSQVLKGVRGGTHLALSVLYYGYLDFWNTGQSELWYSGLAFASVAAAYRLRKEDLAAGVAGIAAGAALLMKPPAMTIVAVAVVLLVRRGLVATAGQTLPTRVKVVARRLALFALGAAILPGLVALYFASHGAIPALLDIVVGANGYYVKHEHPVNDLRDFAGAILGYPWCYFPMWPALVVYLAVMLLRTRRERSSATFERHALAAALFGASYVAVSMQGKWYLLHYTVMLPSGALIAANALRTAIERWPSRPWLPKLWFAPTLLTLWIGAMISWEGPNMWRLGNVHAFRYLTHAESRAVFLDHFQVPAVDFFYRESEQVGTWLRAHTTEADTIAVRGFQPEVYFIAERRHTGRFFWTTFLTSPARAYRREEWLREDRQALLAHPPRYAVPLSYAKDGPDSVAFFEALGYREVERTANFIIMERGDRP